MMELDEIITQLEFFIFTYLFGYLNIFLMVTNLYILSKTRVKLLVTSKPNNLKYIILNYESLGEHIIPGQEVKYDQILEFLRIF